MTTSVEVQIHHSSMYVTKGVERGNGALRHSTSSEVRHAIGQIAARLMQPRGDRQQLSSPLAHALLVRQVHVPPRGVCVRHLSGFKRSLSPGRGKSRGARSKFIRAPRPPGPLSALRVTTLHAHGDVRPCFSFRTQASRQNRDGTVGQHRRRYTSTPVLGSDAAA